MADFTEIAPYYDKMTGFARRLIGDFGVIKRLVEKFEITTALDAGCGSGVHSIILSKLGVDVVGLDASAEMLGLARTNALREGLELKLENEYFETMPNAWTGRFDTVFCLANSLAGVVTGERLVLSMKSFNRVLQPGGRVVIQLLNFMAFRRDDRRMLKVSNEENLTFVRFFDFEEKETRLNVLIIEHELGELKHTFISEKILPINTEIMSLAARAGGFSDMKFFSDLTLTDPLADDSLNMVVVLTK